jgi:PAB-dependent poly(A)-specific ribonuclease subunit 2
MEEPGWRPLHVSLRPSACTAFDTASELLFVGDLHGGIASLFCHDYSRYTAYRAHMLGHATTLLADDKGIFSLGVDSVKCANRRGLAQWNLQCAA